jgi:hypothetical protein
MLVDTLWYLDKTRLRPEAEAVAEAVESYLLSERKGLNVPEREVEEAVAGIADDADPELLLLRYGLTGPLRASSFTWRLISANNCHRFDRRREKDIRLGKGRTKTVTGKEEHPVSRWIRTLADDVVMALIREHPLWLRNAAVADRICKWRIDLLGDDLVARESARQLLEYLAGGGHGRRGRPSIGPRFPARDLWTSVKAVEAHRRAERQTWLRVREGARANATLLRLGEAFWQRVHGWDPDSIKALGRNAFTLTNEQVVMHLGHLLVIVRDPKNTPGRWVAIDDEGWPRASTIALLAARWKVEKGWILKHRPKDGSKTQN